MSFIGVWNLVNSYNFDNFLTFVKVPWYQRTISGLLNIKVKIDKKTDTHYVKNVESYFHNSVEDIILDDKYHTNDDGIKKKYTVSNDIINVDIIGNVCNWKEKIYNDENKNLIIEYYFDGEISKQIFEKE